MKKNLLVTGHPGSGKSTLAERVVVVLDVPVTGFFTQEIRDGGARAGFAVETFDGRTGILAHARVKSPVRVGRCGVDIDVFESIAVPSLRARRSGIPLVIDEIGRMQCCSPLFRIAVMNALDSPDPVFATIAEKGDPSIQAVKAREDELLYRIHVSDLDSAAASIITALQTLTGAEGR